MLKKVEKAKSRKETARAFSGLKSEKTGLAKLRSAENQFHILILSFPQHSLSLSLPLSLFPAPSLTLSPYLTFGVFVASWARSAIHNKSGIVRRHSDFLLLLLSHFYASPFAGGGQCNRRQLCIGPPARDVTRGGGATQRLWRK